MGKRNDYQRRLQPLLEDFSLLENMLLANSGLPGVRANLEAAAAFADSLQDEATGKFMLEKLLQWANIPAQQAPANSKKEFLPFCALQGLAALYYSSCEDDKDRIISTLKKSAVDSRWRTREAVALAFQRLAEKDFRVVRKAFTEWLPGASMLEQRAVIASLAHYPLLQDKDSVLFCLQAADLVLEKVAGYDEQRKKEEFRVLKKGLEYALGVFANSLPDEGFSLLLVWAKRDDADIKKIIRSNLGKARLAKKHPERVEEVFAVLGSAESQGRWNQADVPKKSK